MKIRPLGRYEQTILVKVRTEIARDDFNCPIYEYTEHSVSGCLCVPQEPTDLPIGKWTDVRQHGNQQKMYCYIPKECELDFENAKLYIQGKWWDTFGIPQKHWNPPTRFDRYVIAVRETG